MYRTSKAQRALTVKWEVISCQRLSSVFRCSTLNNNSPLGNTEPEVKSGFYNCLVFALLFQHELGDRLMPAFKSGSPVPYSDVNLRDHTAHAPRWGPDSSTSEVTTIQLEFIDLSRLTGDPKYEVSPTYFHFLCSSGRSFR